MVHNLQKIYRSKLNRKKNQRYKQLRASKKKKYRLKKLKRGGDYKRKWDLIFVVHHRIIQPEETWLDF